MLRSSGMPSTAALDSISVQTVTKNADYTQGMDDTTIRMNAASGPRVLNLLPAATVNERILMVKKIDNTANTVTIDPAGSEVIDGAATLVLSNSYDSVILHSNGVSWDIVAAK